MKLKFNSWLWFISLMLVIPLFGQTGQEVIEAYRNEPTGNSQLRRKGIMDGNLVRTMYFNQGEVGHWPDQPSGEWPKGTGHSYLDGVCLLVGAKVRVNVAGIDTFITPMEAAYREWVDKDPVTGEDWGWEPVPGYLNENGTSPAISNNATSWPTIWPDAIFLALDQPKENWINQAEVNGEPGKDDDRDGIIDNYTYWMGYFGRGINNADVETFFVVDDASDKEWVRFPYYYYPIKSDSSRGGLGLRVEIRGFQWSHVLAEDNIFWHYDIFNLSDTSYAETVFGFLTDVGVGGTNDSGDDNASFDIELDIAYAYDEDGRGTSDFGVWEPTGYQGYAYLESPGMPYNGIDDDLDGLIDERRDDGIDNDGDWTPFTDLNGNGVWDTSEPLNDDLGKDGVGPFDRQYNGPDEGEGDGIPTDGEPNFDRTDKDESDQIGLTSMSIYRLVDGGGGDGWPRHDQGLWRRMSYANFDTSLKRSNIHMLFGSGPFELQQGTRERFSMALLYGNDLEDLVKNKITVQQIYNANYNFTRPPLKPLVHAVPGDGKVFLYWDDIAEESRDPFLPDSLGNPRKDFEGYLIYRSTEPQFNDIKIITDSKGNPVFWKPIAQFDLIDGIEGPDPVGVEGAHFFRGSETGLRHSFVDTNVVNGQTYYYAVVSYDQGDPSFGEEGLPPSECTKNITEDITGNITFVDINCAVVTPNAPAAGYIPPEISGELNTVNGIGSGRLGVEIIDPSLVEDNTTYRVVFHSEGDIPDYTTSSYSIYKVQPDTLLPVLETIDASLFGDENPSPPVEGFVVTAYIDTPVTVNPDLTGWLINNSNVNLTIDVKPHTRFVALAQPWPADYKITFYNDIADTSIVDNKPLNVKVYNITEDREASFILFDNNGDNELNIGDILTIVEPLEGGGFKFAYDIEINPPPINAGQPILPAEGDEFLVSTYRPFYEGDYFEFTTKAAGTDNNLAKNELENIHVVPNPYIGGAEWEPRKVFGSGRGERKIDFIHLPSKCTIRIFTMSGKLVKTIYHETTSLNGAESWNLVSDDGMDISYGIYIFHVEAPGIGEHIGKFAIVK
ncbi:MAG: hypothetical protein Kow00108_15170 [Calditrichia bacterium]